MIRKMKIGDILILVTIILASVFIMFIFNSQLNKGSQGDKVAIIEVNGEEIKRVEINEQNNGLKLPIESDYGYNILEFSEFGVRSIEASCPDKIDVLQGFITEPGEIIVCLPNRLVVQLETVNFEDVNEVDVVN